MAPQEVTATIHRTPEGDIPTAAKSQCGPGHAWLHGDRPCATDAAPASAWRANVTEFRQLVDSFIHPANQHIESVPRENVSMALIYAEARFSSFVVASHTPDQCKFDSDRKLALGFYLREYQRMLNENLDDHPKIYVEGNMRISWQQRLRRRSPRQGASNDEPLGQRQAGAA